MSAFLPAFHGDSAVKQAVLGDIRARNEAFASADNVAAAAALAGNPWYRSGDEQELQRCAAYCDDKGLAPTFFWLAEALDEVSGFAHLATIVDALPLSADADAAVQAWLQWLWNGDRAASLADQLAGSPAFEPAAALLAMRTGKGGARASRAQWRQARRALQNVAGLTAEQRQAVTIVAAMGWDFEEMPAAIGDVAMAHLTVAYEVAHRRAGCDDPELADAKAGLQDLYQRASAAAEASGGKEEDASGEAWNARFDERVAELATPDQAEAMRRSGLAQEQYETLATAAGHELREALLRLLTA